MQRTASRRSLHTPLTRGTPRRHGHRLLGTQRIHCCAPRACVAELRAAARGADAPVGEEVFCITRNNAVVRLGCRARRCSTRPVGPARCPVTDVTRRTVPARRTPLLARAARLVLCKVPGAALHDAVGESNHRVFGEPRPARRAGQERVVRTQDARRRVDATASSTINHSSRGPSFLVSIVHNNLNKESFENPNGEPNGTARGENTIPAGKKGVKSHGSGFLIWKAFTRGITFSSGNQLKTLFYCVFGSS